MLPTDTSGKHQRIADSYKIGETSRAPSCCRISHRICFVLKMATKLETQLSKSRLNR
ncbi:hypothetical protein HanOQP8_Chr09g0334371 [Helianthus annuus]|nr:hypothetical protein HanOQP8_Chr09g0334371 [Helianthus annuus]